MKFAYRLVLALLWVAPLHALELPAIFGDGMVLQRDMPVPVWGKAEPGRQVNVSFNEHQVTVICGAEGDWRADLPALSASKDPANLVVVEGPFVDSNGEIPNLAKATQTFNDVLVGDVWHCSGQSNMEWSVRKSNDAAAEIAAADYPLIRHFTVPRTDASAPVFFNGGPWMTTTHETIRDFSAVGYFFARKIHASQGVPIGLIDTAWGGASAEAFTSMPTLLADPITTQYVEAMNARPLDAPKFRKQHTPAAIFHGMIHPVAPFAHRGVLWYQGESNRDRSVAYRDLMPRMIEDWRQLWDQPGDHRDTPFLIVQLAHYQQPAEAPPAFDAWGELRDAQAFTAASVNNAYLATAVDIGNAKDIHPRNKQDVGLRLARLAEHHVYGDESVVPVGPAMYAIGYDSTEPGVATVRWNHAKGLTTFDGQPPRGFAIRTDASSPWVWANAEIDSRSPTVRLTHPEGLDGPFEVRYAYGINPTDGPQGINLVNGEGLPAMPFRTDPVPAAD